MPKFRNCLVFWPMAGSTLEECRNQLIEMIEGWLIVGIRHGDVLPVLDTIDLNSVIEAA